ncbi:hypothetical protein D3C84_831130 [compost metagenome]
MFSVSTEPMKGSRSRTFCPPGRMASNGRASTAAIPSSIRRLTAYRPVPMNMMIMTAAPIHGPRDSGANRPPASRRAPSRRCILLRTPSCRNR